MVEPSNAPGMTPSDHGFAREPPKGALVNLETVERLDFLFNPETFTEKIGANYARHVIPGLGGQILQYINTTNETIPLVIYMSDTVAMEQERSFRKRWHEEMSDGRGGGPPPLPAELDILALKIGAAKNFLQSLLYPVRTTSGGWKAPPRVLFIWPNVIRLTCVVTSINFNHQRFSISSLMTTALTVELTLEELRTTQKFSDEVRRKGTLSSVRERPVR